MEKYVPRKVPMYFGELSDENISKIFSGAGDFVRRRIRCGHHRLYVYSIDGLTSGGDISDYVIKPIVQDLSACSMQNLFQNALNGGVYNCVADACADLDAVAMKLVNGFCVVLFPGTGAIAFETKTGEKRGLSAPEVENTVKGPKDAFVETVRSNTSLIRRHLRSPDLRFAETTVGRRTLTNVSVVWLEGITNRELVKQIQSRLDRIDIDGFLSPSAVEEYITGSRATAFPLLQYTERTDRFCQGILDGRVGLLVDGLPLGYLAPGDLHYYMESPEDRGVDFISASGIRLLRYGGLLLSLLLPGIYIAMATYHQQMLPLPLLQAMIESKQAVPFSTAVEVLGLLLAFELLQESGVHLPQAIGQSVSIIGGIVVGSAAVEAKVISPVALIAVSVAGIGGFVQPNRDFAQAVRVWRFAIAALAVVGGLFGVTVGFLALLIHLSGLSCLNVDYLSAVTEIGLWGLLRPRLKKDKQRDENFHPEDRRKQK